MAYPFSLDPVVELVELTAFGYTFLKSPDLVDRFPYRGVDGNMH